MRKQIKVNAPDALKHHTLTVTVSVRGLWRLRLGLWIIRRGARLAGLGKVNVVNKAD